MKIIISPSKMQNRKLVLKDDIKRILFPKKTELIYKKISKLTEEEISDLFNIRNALLEKTVKSYKEFDLNNTNHAIATYSGFVFKNIDIEKYSDNSINYLEKHLRILSALYGVMTPLTGICPYRLDMNVKISDINLYKIWEKEINDYFLNEDIIINLASKEFSKILDTKFFNKKIINIEFKEIMKNGKYKIIPSRAKKMRGLMVNYFAVNEITDISKIKQFSKLGYKYNDKLSNEFTYIFLNDSKSN
ncbi:MAG: YaaA family protein [Bacillota bacterium]|nr:YaaA family protein [Bacillota bacterium]